MNPDKKQLADTLNQKNEKTLDSTNENNKNEQNSTVVPEKVTDIDGNVYHTVTIGKQNWLVENLKTTRFCNGDPIPNVTSTNQWYYLKEGAYCWFDNKIENKEIYGALYNWYAVIDVRNIAPVGWHIPTLSEWNEMMTYLGGANVAGGKIKESGYSHWNSPNDRATNSSGFTALPAGYRGVPPASHRGSEIYDIGSRAFFCTFSSGDGSNQSVSFTLDCLGEKLYRYNFQNTTDGLSVRCIKDE